MENLYYKPSGKAPFFGILSLLLGGILAGIALSIVYIALQWFIPFIYLNLFIAIGFGLGILFALNYLIKLGKIRNPIIAVALSLVVAFVAYYSQWALYMSLLLQSTEGGSFFVKTSFNLNTYLYEFMHPVELFNNIKLLVDIGTFSIKSTTVTGWFLIIIWLIEAGIIMGIAPLAVHATAKEPFSESQDNWMDENELPKKLKFIESDEIHSIKTALENSNYSPLLALKDNENEKRFSTLKVHSIDGDDNQYLTIINIEITVNDKGEESKKETDVVKYLRLASSDISLFG